MGGVIDSCSKALCAFGWSVANAGVGFSALRGIDRIKVVIEDLTTDSTLAGVTKEQVRRQSELALRQIGVTVVADSDGAESLLTPVLWFSYFSDPP